MTPRFCKLLMVTVTAILIIYTPADAGSTPKLAPALEQALGVGTKPDSLVEVVIFVKDEPKSQDQVQAVAASPLMSRDTRIKLISQHLKSAPFVTSSSDQLSLFLAAHAQGPVEKHWIVPSVTATIRASLLDSLAKIPNVDWITPNARLELVAPVASAPAAARSTSASTELNLIGVPQLWQKGYTGKGRLVCSFDTGVDGGHPALGPKWRGNHAPLKAAWFSKVKPDTVPYDQGVHGTHTMGIILGSEGADTVGVAPDAEWICAGVIDQPSRDLATTISDILDAFQWALNPDGDATTTSDVPDVILNSWGIPKGLFVPCDNRFSQVIANVEAAGIVTIFAAGNEGPAAMSLRNPADMALTPYNTFSVGAVDDAMLIAPFSSRGPSSCDTNQIKPEVVAPGVLVRSCRKGGGYVSLSGTSMSAPFAAGLVVLCRQYNPDATVDQIKNAIMQSAIDLGPAGEDNIYGHGLINATSVLDYLPSATHVGFTLMNVTTPGVAVPMPGAKIQVQLNVALNSGSADTILGRLVTLDPLQVTVNKGLSDFSFRLSSVAVNNPAYDITLNPNLVNGSQVSLREYFESGQGTILDSVDFHITVGYVSPGTIAEHHTGQIDFTVSDFAQYGLSQGSIYNLSGQGFRFNGGANLLYESGIIVGRNSLEISNSVRDSLGSFQPSNFAPVRALGATITSVTQADQSTHNFCTYTDTHAPIPLPIRLNQESITYTDPGFTGFVLMQYQLVNHTLQQMTNIYLGFMADFDLLGAGDQVGYSQATNMIYQYSTSGPMVGIVALTPSLSFKALSNGVAKLGFRNVDKYSLVSTPGTYVDGLGVGDRLMLVSFGPFDIAVDDSVLVALALVAGNSLDELTANALQAQLKFLGATGAGYGHETLPNHITLDQNYPNPFNPSTTISFTVPTTQDITLEVFNLLGQHVRTLFSGTMISGSHKIDWDGTNEVGQAVASGMYLYRLNGTSEAASRKMILLK